MSKQVDISRRGDILIQFPYDPELVQFIRDNIPGRRWDPDNRIWRCPITSLPEVIDLLEPKGFYITERLKAKRAEAEAKRVKQKQRWDQEKRAKEQLLQRMADGEEAAFIPSANSALTRRLKSYQAYEAVKGEGYYGKQTMGTKVIESDLVAVLSELNLSTDPASRLCELLNYTWNINVEAKEKKKRQYLSSQYRYMKKGPILDELCRLAAKQQVYKWGWKEDSEAPVGGANWVLYFERDGIQCSFHAFERGEGPDFDGDWNGVRHQTFPFERYLSEENALFQTKSR